MSEPTLTKTSARPAMNTRTVTTLAMLSAIAYVVMLLSKLLPSVNGFLDFDFKDVIICIGGFTFGPVAAAAVSIVVAFVEMVTISATGPIGLIMNILSSCCFACVAALIYKRKHTLKGAIIGLIVGCLSATAVMLLWNFLITPIYMGVPRATVAAMLVPVFLPFNLGKYILNAALTMLIYKPIVTALRKANLLAPSSSDAAPVQKKQHLGTILVSLLILITCILGFLVWQGVL